MKKFFKHAVYFFVAAAMAAPLASCEDDDDDEVAEIFSLDSVEAIANTDGTITISGKVTTNKKLKTFTLTDANGKVYDLLENSESEKTREEDGKKWTVTLSGTTLPVDVYTLDVRTRMGTTKTTTIGATYEAILGTSASATGSYISFTNGGKVYKLAEAKAAGAGEIEAILNTDYTLNYGTDAKSDAVSSQCANVAIYNGSVVTSNGTIATVKYGEKNETDHTIAISGVYITSNDYFKVDVETNCGSDLKSLEIED